MFMFKNKLHSIITLLIIFAVVIGTAIYMKKCNSVGNCLMKTKNHIIEKLNGFHRKMSASFSKN